ncbi:MAG TPA: hypothetical protein VHM67_16580 [Gemmatimonadaceae bacterium]|nr:hypothetical protein [Gemmatimonadaceae bacterium]
MEWTSLDSRDAGTLPGELRLGTAQPEFVPPSLEPPQRTDACPGSVRVAASGTSGTERYATWWSPRADSTSWLVAARSVDGGKSWEVAQAIDTLDMITRGCERPAPAIAADSIAGYVHVAYSMRAPEGVGVFFSHSMDRGRLFHSPVPIMYGERLTETAIAALGDTVAIAFVDPNMRVPRVGLAFSRTMGHVFEDRLDVPGGRGTASRPQVALASGSVAVAWIERDPTGAARAVVRPGVRRPAR